MRSIERLFCLKFLRNLSGRSIERTPFPNPLATTFTRTLPKPTGTTEAGQRGIGISNRSGPGLKVVLALVRPAPLPPASTSTPTTWRRTRPPRLLRLVPNSSEQPFAIHETCVSAHFLNIGFANSFMALQPECCANSHCRETPRGVVHKQRRRRLLPGAIAAELPVGVVRPTGGSFLLS
jgi:hypothetical protein